MEGGGVGEGVWGVGVCCGSSWRGGGELGVCGGKWRLGDGFGEMSDGGNVRVEVGFVGALLVFCVFADEVFELGVGHDRWLGHLRVFDRLIIGIYWFFSMVPVDLSASQSSRYLRVLNYKFVVRLFILTCI